MYNSEILCYEILKQEIYYGHKFYSYEHLKQTIEDFIKYYNEERTKNTRASLVLTLVPGPTLSGHLTILLITFIFYIILIR